MSSNGFLQILDLRVFELPRLLRIGQPRRRRVIRAVAQSTGSWTVFTAAGGCHQARLTGGWVLSRGALIGLCWRGEDDRSFAAITSVRLQAPGIGRRLLTRLRWPLPQPAALS